LTTSITACYEGQVFVTLLVALIVLAIEIARWNLRPSARRRRQIRRIGR
jgi:hypothetical protein